LPHEIFQMVPFNIVREVSHINTPVLLRGLPNVVHGITSGSSVVINTRLCGVLA
jgi:hypothetical protein